eukprot:5062130-Prymnesium_polylepis.1
MEPKISHVRRRRTDLPAWRRRWLYESDGYGRVASTQASAQVKSSQLCVHCSACCVKKLGWCGALCFVGGFGIRVDKDGGT